jgi:hypothetical protein
MGALKPFFSDGLWKDNILTDILVLIKWRYKNDYKKGNKTNYLEKML